MDYGGKGVHLGFGGVRLSGLHATIRREARGK